MCHLINANVGVTILSSLLTRFSNVDNISSSPILVVSTTYEFGGVDSGSCLEEYPHHTEMTLLGCHHQRSKAILWSIEGGGGAKVVCGFTHEMHASIVSRSFCF